MSAKIGPSPDNVVLGAGEILINRFDSNGVETGYFHLGNSDDVRAVVTTEELIMKNAMRAARGIYKRVIKETAVELKIRNFEFNPVNMALLYMGDVAKTTQAGATVTSEPLTPAGGLIKGRFYTTLQRAISAVTIEKGATPLVVTDDYVIKDPARGLIQILEDATLAGLVDGDDLTIDYTSAALTGATALDYIRAANNPRIEAKVLFISDNQAGPNWEYEFWNVNLKPDGEVALIGEDWASWNLSGSAQDDSVGAHGGSADEPFFRKMFRAA
jgi:hypothetical protein